LSWLLLNGPYEPEETVGMWVVVAGLTLSEAMPPLGDTAPMLDEGVPIRDEVVPMLDEAIAGDLGAATGFGVAASNNDLNASNVCIGT